MSIKTNLFTDTLMKSFFDDFSQSEYYLFGSDYNLSSESTNSNASKLEVLEKTIFGKKLQPIDFSYMIRKILWQPGTVYDQYDDTREDQASSKFYAVIEPDNQEGGYYYVFKCISNNYGSPSNEKPVFSNTLYQTNSNYELADGYVWKYVSAIPSFLSTKFETTNFVPILNDPLIELAAVDGIDVILVENVDENVGYERKTGSVLFDVTSDTVFVSPTVGETMESTPGFYSNRALYVQKSENSVEIGARQYRITNSGQDALGQYFVTISGYDAVDFAISSADTYQLLPRVSIEGDGSGASAIALLDVTNTKIVGISVLDVGSGYRNAVAYISPPSNFNSLAGDIECTLRPIIPPAGGHGSNIVEEMLVDRVGISSEFNATDAIPKKGSFSKIALVRNPVVAGSPNSFDNRVKLNLVSTTGLSIGMFVFQTNGVEGIVHDIVGNDVYISNYCGPYSAIFVTNIALKTTEAGDFSINTVESPPYTMRTGQVLNMVDFTPTVRTDTSVEKIKILIDF